jgi:hypothetical protein
MNEVVVYVVLPVCSLGTLSNFFDITLPNVDDITLFNNEAIMFNKHNY